MEASRVTVKPETLRFTRMPRYRKAMLREQNVVELLKSKPYGAKTTLAEIQAVCGYGNYMSAYNLIGQLKKRGVITILSRHSKFGNVYVVNSEVKTTPITITKNFPTEVVEAEPIGGGPTEEPATPAAIPVNEAPATTSHADLLRLSKDFAWENNSDSLREFVAWVANRG